MRRAGKVVAGLGWRGLLALLGSISTLGASGCAVTPLYGVQLDCTKNSDCTARFAGDWYCDNGTCSEHFPDAGR